MKKIVIIGGGSSGWMTAAFLSSTIAKSSDLEITLIESADIGAIGVGEATIPTLRGFLENIGVDEGDFLRSVNGAFKQAIRFQNWRYDPVEKPTYFYHPFRKGDAQDIHAAKCYMTLFPGYSSESFGKYSTIQSTACDLGLAPKRSVGDAAGGLDDTTYAYHMDAILFGAFLRSKFESRPVRRVEGLVDHVNRAESGDVVSVGLMGGGVIEGDFFIDCSGFRGLLINQALGVPFESFSKWLPCDRAVAASAPYLPGARINPYTIAAAQKSGWIWDISLSNRRGVGYVYSSAHTSDEEAESVLRNYLGSAANDISPRRLNMRVGCGEVFWSHNCVAIGLAGGFIEPLESTGIYLTEMGIRYLVDNWPTWGEADNIRRENYSERMRYLYEEVRAFVLMHYVTSARKDSAFWRDITSGEGIPMLSRRLELWRNKYPSSYDVSHLDGSVFGYESYLAILAGMGFFQGVANPLVKADPSGLMAQLGVRVLDFKRRLAGFPTHEEYLRMLRD